jgi:hypothetical protein
MATLWSKYGKAIAAVFFALLTAAQAAVADGHISQIEGVQIAIAGATAVAVFLAPILPHARGVKTAVAVVLAVLNVLVTAIVGGISASDLTELALAALTVLGVGVAPAQSTVRSPLAAP